MLRELSIVNFAIIDDLKISFSEGLTILSGETGAGKSIVINAVGLLLGVRASAKLVRTGADQAELEALFQIAPGTRVAEIMMAQGYGSSEALLIHRIISRGDSNPGMALWSSVRSVAYLFVRFSSETELLNCS